MTPSLQKYLLYTNRIMNLEQLEYYKEYMPSAHYNAIMKNFNNSICDSEEDYQMDLTVIIIPDIKWYYHYELIMVLDEKYIIHCGDVRNNSPLDITLTQNHLEEDECDECQGDLSNNKCEYCNRFSNKEGIIEHIPKNQQKLINSIKDL
jgi:hypothetical protein